MDHVPLAQLDALEGGARGLGLDPGSDDRSHRPVLVDQLNDDADVTDQFGGQDLDAGLDELLAHSKGVWARAQGRCGRGRNAHGGRRTQGRKTAAGPRAGGVGVHGTPAIRHVRDVHR